MLCHSVQSPQWVHQVNQELATQQAHAVHLIGVTIIAIELVNHISSSIILPAVEEWDVAGVITASLEKVVQNEQSLNDAVCLCGACYPFYQMCMGISK